MGGKISKDDLQNYPGDMVLRANSGDLNKFYNIKESASGNFLVDAVTMTILASSLEETSIIVNQINKNTEKIADNILATVLKEFLEIHEIDSMDGFEETFEHHVHSLEGHAHLKLNISGRKGRNKQEFTSQVVFRSNGGYDEIIKALPAISNKTYFNREVKRIIDQR